MARVARRALPRARLGARQAGASLAFSLVFLSLTSLPARADVKRPVLVVDADDDDVNGVPDGAEPSLAPHARADVAPLDEPVGSRFVLLRGGEHARLMSAGRPVGWSTPLGPSVGIQGLSPGVVELEVRRGTSIRRHDVSVVRVGFRDGEGHDVDPTTSHASLERVPPPEVTPAPEALYDDPDALRLFVETPDAAPPSLAVESVSATGVHLDLLAAPPLTPVACAPAGPVPAPPTDGLHCFATSPLRFVIDEVDRRHALAVSRSLRAELGGAIVVRHDGKKLQALRVLGPRASPVGPIGRFRAAIRPIVVRVSPGGTPAIGGNDAGAVTALHAELRNAAAVWGQCGVSFGVIDSIAVHLVDPPPSHLLAVGDDLGLPASGGTIEIKVGRVVVSVPTRMGELPVEVAYDVERAVERAGLLGRVAPNARVASAANPSADVSVRHRDGALAVVESPRADGRVSTDATLSVRIGAVDLADGLSHFGDIDSVAGTLEERTLLKAYDDEDPRTLEVVVVPFFAGGGRIGESFIGSDRSSLRNVVLLDRAGVRARRSSLTLAHELGHVLLDVPGHPDDYGVDTPTRLMDADASDASPFGPRRITLAECARVIRQSGPDARSPLLTAWPLAPLSYPPLTAR